MLSGQECGHRSAIFYSSGEGSVYRAERSGADIAMGEGYRAGTKMGQHADRSRRIRWAITVPRKGGIKRAVIEMSVTLERFVSQQGRP